RTTLQGARNTENILEIRAYLTDFDGIASEVIETNLRLLGIRPHLLVQSSEGKWHFYWFIEGAALDKFRTTQEKLNRLMGSDGSIKDLPRVMRLPGFIHQKDGVNPSVVKIVHKNDGPKYANADFQQALAKALEKNRAQAINRQRGAIWASEVAA